MVTMMPPTHEAAGLLFFDTVTLSNFALARSLDLLITRYGDRAQVTQEVLNEVTDGIVAGYGPLSLVEEAVTSGKLNLAAAMGPEERGMYREFLRVLAPGEASCIACATIRGGAVVTDDRTARDRCREHRIAFTGTIGILKACVRDKALLSVQADRILESMIAAGYRSPVARVSGVL